MLGLCLLNIYLAGLEVRPLKDDNEPLLRLLGRTRGLPLLRQLQLSLRRRLSLLSHHMCVRARAFENVRARASENVRARAPASQNVRVRAPASENVRARSLADF